ncbi:MAG: trehalase, partial [Acidobacteriota bacterium]|nr:trehalase [Acidobacteriota bacterium]
DMYYRHAASYFVSHPGAAAGYLVSDRRLQRPSGILGPLFPVYICDPEGQPGGEDSGAPKGCEEVEKAGLTPSFYKGDRSLRESGFDITFKFGPFGNATDDYAALGLNCLLYREEEDLAWMSRELHKPADAQKWLDAAQLRRERIDHYFWNPQRGLYFDYNFKSGKQSSYFYATTFYPLWAGASSPTQAAAVIKNLKVFDEPGGIVMSRTQSGGQWDYPYGWAPIQLIAIDGLRRYGDRSDADHISQQFLTMVNENFLRDHTIREKYNVVTRSSETQVKVGYSKNQVGFGWTNGVFVTLLHSELRLPAH